MNEMEESSMTALVSAFSRAYHSENNTVKIFDDSVAKRLLSDEAYDRIADSMADGLPFFNPGFTGSRAEGLRWIVDRQLSPAPLGRAAFAEDALHSAVQAGAGQYLILAAGYDTFAYRQPDWARGLQIFEIDHPQTAGGKRARLLRAGLSVPENVHFVAADFAQDGWEASLSGMAAFDAAQQSFCSLLGLTYYVSARTFQALLAALATRLPRGSRLAFDYPDAQHLSDCAGAHARKQAALAATAGEAMQPGYTRGDMERLLAAQGFALCSHLTPEEMTGRYFSAYNAANPAHPMAAFDNVNYCLAERV